MKKIQFKRDKYKNSRGGHSRLLELHCYKCDDIIALYQKDGPGNLRRLYMDRILSPKNLIGLQYENINNVRPLRCDKCKFIVGMPYIYEKEKRKAFRIFRDAIVKKIKKMNN